MIRTTAVLGLAAIGFVAATPAQAQPAAAVPDIFVAADGTIVVVPSGPGVASTSGTGSGTDLTRPERPASPGKGPSERQLAGPVFSEGNLNRSSTQSAPSVAATPRQADRAAGCAGCGTEQQARAESNSRSASYAVPYEFINPYTLDRSRAPVFPPGGTRSLLDSPALPEARQPQQSEGSAMHSSKPAEEKRADASRTKDLVDAPGRSDKERSKGTDVSGALAASLPVKKGHEKAREKVAAGSSSKSEGKHGKSAAALPAAALSAAAIPSSLGNGGGGVGAVPEPEVWMLTLLGVLGAALLRRRNRPIGFVRRGPDFARGTA